MVRLLLIVVGLWCLTGPVAGKCVASLPDGRELSGVVMSMDSKPLTEVLVALKGTVLTTRSDEQGRWSLNIGENRDVVLLFSALGYETKEIRVSSTNRQAINISLARKEAQDKKGNMEKLRNAKATLNLQNVSVATVLKEIQQQTGFYFVYNSREVEKLAPISRKCTNESVKDLLDNLFVWNNITYEFTDKGVIILKAVEKEQKVRLIHGQVTESNGRRESLPFVTVAVKGTTLGTSTNDDGLWQLFIKEDEKVTLVFSCVGMETQEVEVSSAMESINVAMKPSNVALDEVVVMTGYEKIDKRKLTGSVVSVKGEDVIEPIGSSIDKMLQGKLAGVQVTQNTSTPGAAPKIRIRGNSTILGNREPVWVVDGIVMEDPVKVSAADLNSMDRVNLVGNAISFLNPEDIERIDVLKDVSATAIYGVKAANGVVVVTTKRGKEGKPSFSYTLNMGIKTRPSYRTTNLMNSTERIDVSEEIARRGLLYAGGGVSSPKVAYEGLLQDYWDRKIDYAGFVDGVNVLRRENTDWFKTLMHNSFNQTHNLAISGGSAKHQYYLSASVTDEKDVQRNTSLMRYTVNLNSNMQLLEQLKLNIGLTTAYSTTDRTHSSLDLLGYAYETARTIRLRDEYGKLFYYPLDVFENPNGERGYIGYNILNEMDHSYAKNVVGTVNLNASLAYDITKWLCLNAVLGYSLDHTNMEEVADEQSYYISTKRKVPYGTPMPDDPAFRRGVEIPFGGELSQNNTRSSTYNLRATLSFNKEMGPGFLELQAGTEVRSTKYDGTRTVAWGYLPDRGKKFANIDLKEYELYANRLRSNHPQISDNLNNTISWFGIGRYSLWNKYIVNFNIRYDGSNRFGNDRSTRFLPVWSVSGRWNLHSEKFMKDIAFIDALGLKASYGAQGNVVEGQTPYMVISQGIFNTNTNQYVSSLNSYPNPKLRWEKTMSWQLGADFSFFSGLLSGSFEYYSKTGRDQVVTKRLAQSNGIESVVMNGGTLWNKGWDLGFSFVLLDKRDWKWNFTVNVSRNTSRIRDTENSGARSYSDYLSGSVIINNMSVNTLYAYQFDGLDIDGLPSFKGGDLRDENGIPVTTFEEAIACVMVPMGQRDPKVSGGFTTGLRFKGWSLGMNFAYALGHKVRLNKLYKESGQQLPLPQQNWSKDFVNRWQKPGDDTNIPVLSDKDLSLASMGNQKFSIGNNYWQMYNDSDIRVVPGDYLRCTSMSLNYSFSARICQTIKAKGLTCGFTCSNVFVLADKELNGQDPEQVGFGSRTTPPQRTYSLSLSVNF